MIDSPSIRWEKPPSAPRPVATSGIYVLLLEEIKKRPRRWAHIRHFAAYSSAPAQAYNLRARFKDFEFEARRDSKEPRKGSDLYARFLGPRKRG